jgi:hypothetical protein
VNCTLVAAHGGVATPCNSRLLRVVAPCPAPPQTHTSPCPTDLFRVTNVVSNNAVAVIGAPIAISIAKSLQLPAESFVLAVLFGVNMSYAAPMAYLTNLLLLTL